MKKIFNLATIGMVCTLIGCEKFLDEKSDRALVIPSTLRDAQSLLDNYSNINGADAGEGEVAADDYYLTDGVWSALRAEEDKRAYVWAPDYATQYNRWWLAYRNVYYANIVLESLQDMQVQPYDQQEWNDIKGQALFLRAKSFLNVVTIWSQAFDDATADDDFGIPLRLSADYNIPSRRATIRETYRRITTDLLEAIDLLPDRAEVSFRSSKSAAMGLLARTYLFMRDYDSCLRYADASLRIDNYLLDYNDIDSLQAYPLSAYENNEELAYFSYLSSRPQLSMSNALVDSSLFAAYKANDLRRALFFRDNGNGTQSFRGSYAGAVLFSGVARDEIYLMRAECFARKGEIQAALDDLNHLLAHRYKRDSFVPFATDSPDRLLGWILEERRKELLFRGIRFPDVKRLNKEGATIGFTRILEGQQYTLPPNDLRFALPIPEEVIERAPEIEQNPK